MIDNNTNLQSLDDVVLESICYNHLSAFHRAVSKPHSGLVRSDQSLPRLADRCYEQNYPATKEILKYSAVCSYIILESTSRWLVAIIGIL